VVSRFAVQRIADWLETPISPEDLALLSEWANGLATTSHRWRYRHQHRDHHRYAVRAKKAAYDYGFQAGKREGRASRKLVAEKSFSRGYQEGLAHRDIEVLADPGITGNTMATTAAAPRRDHGERRAAGRP